MPVPSADPAAPSYRPPPRHQSCRLDLSGQERNGGTKTRRPLRHTRSEPPPNCCAYRSPPDSWLKHPTHWYMRSDAGEIAPWYCRSWSCPNCAPAKASWWAEVILHGAHPQRRIDITALGPDPDLARRKLRSIIKAFRRGQFHGSGSRRQHIDCEYFAALETHANGSIHAHLLQHGRSVPKRRLSAALPAYGAGSVCWVQSMSTARAPAAVARYCANHLIGTQHTDQTKLGRRVRYSRRFFRGSSPKAIAADLWPRDPTPATWVLVGPRTPEQRALAEAAADDWRTSKRALYEDRQLRSLLASGWTDHQLVRAGFLFPSGDSPDPPKGLP